MEVAPDFIVSECLTRFTDQAIAWIEGKAADARNGNPFFPYLPYTPPHKPVIPVGKFRGQGQAGTYGEFMIETDWHLRRLLDLLDREKLSENTILIYTADNGLETTWKERSVPAGVSRARYPPVPAEWEPSLGITRRGTPMNRESDPGRPERSDYLPRAGMREALRGCLEFRLEFRSSGISFSANQAKSNRSPPGASKPSPAGASSTAPASSSNRTAPCSTTVPLGPVTTGSQKNKSGPNPATSLQSPFFPLDLTRQAASDFLRSSKERPSDPPTPAPEVQ